jgi:hypothetical protein
MKPTMLLIAGLLATTPLMKAAATTTPKPASVPSAEVVYVDPDKFTDVRDSYTSTDSGRDELLDQMREHILTESKRRLPAGYKLFMSVTDVDLAGDFEPWHGVRWDDIRIVKDIYPPRMVFSFRVTDPSGRVVKEGNRDLRDLAFMMKITMAFHDDPLRHEKQMIDDWFNDEFRDLKKQ